MPKVFNKRHNNYPPNSVYVGRPSKWGNPHPMDQVCKRCSTPLKQVIHDRKGAVEAFKADLNNSEGIRERIKRDLAGVNLVCWCAPQACHADVLLEIANGD